MSESPRLTWEFLTLELKNPFRVAYGVSETRQAGWLRLAGDAGWGEGTIPPYYGISRAAIAGCWQAAAERRDPLPKEPAEIDGWIGPDGPAPARTALDLALHDRVERAFSTGHLTWPPSGSTFLWHRSVWPRPNNDFHHYF